MADHSSSLRGGSIKFAKSSRVHRDPLAPPGNLGMCGVAMFHNRFVLSCGGSIQGSHTPTNKLYCYDLKRAKWLPISSSAPDLAAALPVPLFGHSLVAHGSSAWICGGMTGTSILKSFLHLQFDFAESVLSSMGPEKIVLLSCSVYPSNLTAGFAAIAKLQMPTTHAQLALVIGGLTIEKGMSTLAYTNRVVAVNLEEVSMHRVQQEGMVPSPRAGAAACVIPDANGPRVVLHGGKDSRGILEDLFVGVISCDEARGGLCINWAMYTPPPAGVWPGPRLGHCLTFCAPHVVLTGGCASDTEGAHDGDAASHRIFVLSCSTSSCGWTETGPSVGRTFHRALAIDEGLILVGGSRSIFLRIAPIDHSALRAALSDAVSTSIQFCATLEVAASPSKPLTVEISLPKEQLSVERLKTEIAKRMQLSGDPDDLMFSYRKSSTEIEPLNVGAALEKAVQRGRNGVIELIASIDTPPQSYKLLQEVGRGSFGEVFIALNESDGSLFAVKIVTVPSPEKLDGLRKEIRMMRQLKHPNIVQYLGSRLVGDKMHIFMDYIAGGDTLEKLCRKCVLPMRAVQMYTRQLLHALCFLHGQGIVHRDIKGANVLLNVGGVVKLSDFGTAKHLQSAALSASLAGTAFFMAPEVMRSLPYGTPVDIWSLGCLVIELVSGRYPYEDLGFTNIMQIAFHVTQKGEPPAVPARMTSQGAQFLRRCFNVDPDMRPTAAELLKDPFVTDLEEAGAETPPPTNQLAKQPPPPQKAPAFRSKAVVSKPAKLLKRPAK